MNNKAKKLVLQKEQHCWQNSDEKKTKLSLITDNRLSLQFRSEMSITKETSKIFKVIKWIYDNPVTINRNSNKMDKYRGEKKKSLSKLSQEDIRHLNILKHQKSEAVDKNTRPRWLYHLNSSIKNPTCNAGDLSSIPGLGRSPGGYPLQYSGQENSMNCIVRGVAKSRTWLSDSHYTI